MSDLVLATELIEEFNKMKNDSDKIIQTGGVFSNISEVPKMFKAVGGFLKNLFAPLVPILFGYRAWKVVRDPETGIESFKVGFKYIHLPPGQGYFYRFIWFCIKSSFYIVIFALGGFWVTILAIVFIYTKLAGKFKKMRYGDVDD